MRLTKENKQLIHSVFQLARTKGLTLYMNPKDYDKFFDMCQSSINGEAYNGADYTQTLIVTDYREAIEKKSLWIDFNSVYGGYCLQQLGESGSVHDILPCGMQRFSAESLRMIINAYNAGLLQGRA